MSPKKLQNEKAIKELADYADVSRALINKYDKERADLQHLIATLNIQERQLRDRLIRQENEHRNKLKQEETASKQKIQQELNRLIDKTKEFELRERSILEREKELQEAEVIHAKINEAKKEIINDRIEVQRMKSGATELMDRATREAAEAEAKLARANSLEASSKKLNAESRAIRAELVDREDRIKEEEKNLAAQINNYTKIQKEVDPKLKEITDKQAELAKQLKEISSKEENVLAIHAQNEAMARTLADRKNEVDAKERKVSEMIDRARRDKLIKEIK